jgi:hypothetical protein
MLSYALLVLVCPTDELRPTVKTEDLEKWPQAGSAFNIGIMLFRPKSKQFVGGWWWPVHAAMLRLCYVADAAMLGVS